MPGDAFLDWRAPSLRTGRSNGEVVRWRSTVEEPRLRLPVHRRQSRVTPVGLSVPCVRRGRAQWFTEARSKPWPGLMI